MQPTAVHEHGREQRPPVRVCREHTLQPGTERYRRAWRYRLEYFAGDQSELADGARQWLRRAGTLNEQPSHDVEEDDADSDNRGELGGVFIFVRNHREKIRFAEDGGVRLPPTSTTCHIGTFSGNGGCYCDGALAARIKPQDKEHSSWLRKSSA